MEGQLFFGPPSPLWILREDVQKSDYYTKDIGTWGGKGAEFFGREGDVERKDFVALANNKWPGVSGKD